MKKFLPIFLFFLFTHSIAAQSIAWERTKTLGKGMNLSWMENWWDGTSQNDFSDYLNMNRIVERKADLLLMKEMDIKTIRLPICFDVWVEQFPPYDFKMPEYFEAVDSILFWAKENEQNIIIDYQHGQLSDAAFTENAKRLIAIWKKVATRYKDTDPDKVFFELFNEPHDISLENWLAVVHQLISTIRAIAPEHSIIVGGVDYNGIVGLEELPALIDQNIIYTFHFYEPFLFTHQGAEWVGNPATTTGIPFPYNAANMPPMASAAANTFGEDHYYWYNYEGQKDYLRRYLETVKKWSLQHDLPVFCGEWGSHFLADQTSRCEHAETVLKYLQELNIPYCYWEWDRNFSFFNGTPSYTNLPDCMLAAWNKEIPKAPASLSPSIQLLIPNPFAQELEVYFPDPDLFQRVKVYSRTGQWLGTYHVGGSSWIMDTSKWASGLYFLHFQNVKNQLYQVEKVWKE